MNAAPSTPGYSHDLGVFVSMLPELEDHSLFTAFNKNVPTNSISNKHLINTLPSVLKCPTAGPSARLTAMSDRFSGNPVTGIDGVTCDYMGNDGSYRDGRPVFGAIRIRIEGISRKRRLAEILDGTSQTLMFWESVGDQLWMPKQKPVELDRYCSSEFFFFVDGRVDHTLRSSTQASTKSYLFSWTGFRSGCVIPYDPRGVPLLSVSNQNADMRVLNVANDLGQPFSKHFGLVPFSMCDGSVRGVNVSVDSKLVISQSTAHEGDLVNDFE